MERSLMQRIEKLHRIRRSNDAGSRLRYNLQLLLLYVSFGFHRAWLLLATDPSRSFTKLHSQNIHGIWPVSYADHLRFRVRMRVYAFGSVMCIIASTAITVSLIQLSDQNTATYALTIVQIENGNAGLTSSSSDNEQTNTNFSEHPSNSNIVDNTPSNTNTNNTSEETNNETPSSDTLTTPNTFSPSSFSASTINSYTVTTTTPNVAGSLQTAINSANAGGGGDTNEISFTTAGTYTLPAESDISRKVLFTNESGGDVIIDGSALGGSDSCFNFVTGATQSSVSNIQFVDCPTAITVDGANAVTIGGSSADAVVISGGTQGIDVTLSTSSVVIDHVTVGINDAGIADPLTGIGIEFDGYGGTITNSTIGNALTGIDIAGDDCSVSSSFVGLDASGNDHGNTTHGIVVTGQNVTVGGNSESDENFIGNNGNNGVVIQTEATTTMVQNNTIGLDGDDNAAGNGEENISVEIASGELATILENRIAFAGTDGIAIESGTGVIVAENAIFSNTEDGLYITGGDAHVIELNTFGLFTSATEETSVGSNGDDNISVSGGATDVAIGSEESGNDIFYASDNGIVVDGATTERIHMSRNTYEQNTNNDILLRNGANNGIDRPEITHATAALIQGTGGDPSGVVEVYADGEYVGTDESVSEDGSWSLSLTETATSTAVTQGASFASLDTKVDVTGQTITALTSDSERNSSSFSDGVEALAVDNDFGISTSVDATPTRAVITITADEAVSTTLSYGTTAHNLNRSEESGRRKREHTITLTGLRPHTRYYYTVTATDADANTSTTTTTSFTTSSATPEITSLSGDYSVVTTKETLQFEGSVSGRTASHFRFVNVATQETIAVCDTDEHHVCTLPFTLGIGEYDIYFDSNTSSGEIKESSGAHRLIVSPPIATNILTTDTRSEQYYTRVVLSDSVLLTGLKPKNSTPVITVAGVTVDDAVIEETGESSFAATLNLSALQRGQDYLIEITFQDDSTHASVGTSIYYPIHFAYAVVEPLVTDLAAAYPIGADSSITITGGANDTVTVLYDGNDYLSALLSPIQGTVQGVTTFSIPTNSFGTHTLTIQSSDRIGLTSSQQTYSYIVYDPTANNNIENPDTGEENPDDGETENPENPPSDDGEENPDNEGTENPPNTIDEKATLKERLNQLLRSTLTIEGRRQIVDANGTLLSEGPLQENSTGDVVLRNKKIVGLQPSSWFTFGDKTEMDVLQLSGISEPFATITLTIFSDPIVQVTQADDTGAWKMNIAISALPEGEHTAFLKAESNGVESDEIEIAKFVVIQEQQLSNTSWIFIANIIIALLIVSVIITLRIQHRKEIKKLQAIRVTKKEMTPSDLVTELRKKQSADSDDDDLHSALGV